MKNSENSTKKTSFKEKCRNPGFYFIGPIWCIAVIFAAIFNAETTLLIAAAIISCYSALLITLIYRKNVGDDYVKDRYQELAFNEKHSKTLFVDQYKVLDTFTILDLITIAALLLTGYWVYASIYIFSIQAQNIYRKKVDAEIERREKAEDNTQPQEQPTNQPTN